MANILLLVELILWGLVFLPLIVLLFLGFDILIGIIKQHYRRSEN